MNKYDEVYVGTVVANDDPTRCERVKVTIPNMFQGSPEVLPWIVPNLARSQGQGMGVGVFGVPIVGAKVYIEFQFGDPNFPMYSGGVVSRETLIPEAAEDYPHCWGYVDAKGNKMIVNTLTGVTRVIHNSGTTTRIEADGAINETVVSDYNLNIAGNYSVTVGGSSTIAASGSSAVTAGGGLALAGQGMSMSAGSGGAGGGTATMQGNFVHEGNLSSTGNMTVEGNLGVTANVTVGGNVDASGTVHGSNI